MADWNASNITLTAKGSSALSRVEAGDGSLTITRVVASEQYVQESTLREVTTLSVENLELTIIDRHEVEDGGSVIQAQLSNLNLTKKFTLNEIGVFATHSSDPDNEFLYIIAQVDLNTGDEIPLYSVTPVTATYDIYLYNVGADKVNVTISSAGLVTYEALNAICGLARRNAAYELGQIANHASLPTGMYLECVVAGTTASIPISLPTSPKEGDMIKDGSVTWVLSKAPSSRKLGYLQPSTAYTVGNIAYHSALPTGWCLECTTAGTSGTSAVVLPNPLVDGATITDGTITWTLRKLATNGELGYRQPSTAQSVGDIRYHVTLPAGWYLECTTEGETGSGALTITSPTVGGTVSDGTVTWIVRKMESAEYRSRVIVDSAAAHNAIYRGKDLTAYFNSGEMSAAIADGSFRNIYPGDFITKSITINGITYSNVKFIIMDLDYHLHRGDNETTAHHVAIMPEEQLGTAQMNSSHTTEGGYVGSAMWTAHIPKVVAGFEAAFGAAHILEHRELLGNVMDANLKSNAYDGWSGATSGWAWTSVKANLVNENMVYGAPVLSSSFYDTGECNSQLSAFRLNHGLICSNRYWWWLRSVANSSAFCHVSNNGHADYGNAAYSGGVRPIALLR